MTLLLAAVLAAAVAAAGGPMCPAGFRPVQSAAPLSSNGCGAAGMNIKVDTGGVELAECCDVHDACYSMCGVPKAECEKEFKQCMETKCRQAPTEAAKSSCKQGAAMYAMGAAMMGQQFYDDAQAAGCTCVKAGDAAAVRAAYAPHLERVVANSPPSDATRGKRVDRDAQLAAALAKLADRKNANKEGQLLLRFVRRAPGSIQRDAGHGGEL